jgi:hypothetical protein
MSEKHKSISPRAVHVRIQQKSSSTDEKLDIIRQFEKGEQIADICHNVRFTHSSVHKFMIMLIGLQKVLNQELQCLCSKTTTVLLNTVEKLHTTCYMSGNLGDQ